MNTRPCLTERLLIGRKESNQTTSLCSFLLSLDMLETPNDVQAVA